MPKAESARLRLYVGAVAVAATIAAGMSQLGSGFTLDASVLMLAATALVVAMLPVKLPGGGDVSITAPVMVAILVLAGPTTLAVVYALVSLVPDLRPRKPAIKIVFNVAQLVASSLTAAWLYSLVSLGLGVSVPATSLSPSDYPAILAGTCVFAVVFPLLNSALVGGAITLSQGAPFGRVWLSNFSAHLANQVALSLLGVALAQAMLEWGAFGLLAFLVPLFVSRGVFHSYVTLRLTYADTIRGLVAAIEAKDPYTRGHSERVARYTVAIAESMGLPWARIERLELAALLHDLGKVGIGRRVLTKPGRLTDEEMDEIRKHPELAADIIEAVPFLAGTVPAIIHHHERYDGNGYRSGLAGEKIPPDARILSVADCYDAMTSERPYKKVLSHEQAIDELLAGAGTQFDPYVVEVFCRHVAVDLHSGPQIASA